MVSVIPGALEPVYGLEVRGDHEYCILKKKKIQAKWYLLGFQYVVAVAKRYPPGLVAGEGEGIDSQTPQEYQAKVQK